MLTQNPQQVAYVAAFLLRHHQLFLSSLFDDEENYTIKKQKHCYQIKHDLKYHNVKYVFILQL